MGKAKELAELGDKLVVDVAGTTISGGLTSANIPEVDLTIAPEVLEIQIDAPGAGQNPPWLWTWEQSTLPYARRTITNSPEVNVPLYKQGTYTVNNFAKSIHGSMTQTHTLYFKWVDGAGTDNLISWVTDQGNVTDSHPDINGGTSQTVQRLSISVPATITVPTLTAPTTVTYGVTNNGAGAYTFSDDAHGDNPNIGPLYRGGTYTFNVNAVGHPFYLTTDNGTNYSAGTYFGEYTTGVTNSRTDNGTITFTVPAGAPDTLYYQCGNHSAMRGAITIRDLAVETNNNGNYVVYAQHDQEGHKTPIELRPIPSLVNQMCIVYDASVNKFVPQDLATYVENTPSFENKIREVAGTAELVVEDGSAVVAKVNIYADSTYLPLVGNNAGDQAFATDVDILYIWDGSAWQQAGVANTDQLTEGSTNLYYTDARADARVNLGIANLVDSAPATLDTLNELAAALGDDPNFATTTANNIASKLSLTGGTMTGTLTVTGANTHLDGRNSAGLTLDLSGTGHYTIKETATNDIVHLGGTGSSNFIAHNISSGNVGIGATNPGEKLTVSGNIQSSGNITAKNSSTGNGAYLGTDGGIEIFRNANDGGFIDFKSTTAEDYDVRIQTYTNGEMLRFTLGGQSSTSTAMEIGDPNSATYPSIFAKDDYYAGANAGDFYKSASFRSNHSNVAYFDFIDYRDGDNATYTGWTGMGKRIQMKIDSTYMGWMQFNGAGNNGGISFGTGTQGAGNDPTLVPEKMRIEANGNVAINSTSADENLDVNGVVRSKGNDDPNYSISVVGRYDSTHPAAVYVRGNSATNSEIIGVWGDAGGANLRTVINPGNGWNVGIGTTSPAAKLDIASGSIRLDGGYNIEWGSGFNSGGPAIWGDPTNTKLRFAPEGNSSGITVEMANNLLTVNGDVKAYSYDFWNGRNTRITQTGPNTNAVVDTTDTGAIEFHTDRYFLFLEADDGGPVDKINTYPAALFVDANYQKVVIGDRTNRYDTPSHTLDVRATDENTGIRLHRYDNTNLDPIGIGFSTRSDKAEPSGDTRAGIYYNYNGNLFLAAKAATNIDSNPLSHSQLYIDGVNNRVGIGYQMTAPQATLHVDGDLLTNDLILNNMDRDEPNEVDGTRGHWTIQEGAEDLFLINRLTGKKYKFNITEVDE